MQITAAAFKDWQIEEFLRCKDEFLADHIPGNCMRHITARDFYEACAVCYKAVRMEQRVHFPFRDAKEEHLRYNGTTPKELYYMFADGRVMVCPVCHWMMPLHLQNGAIKKGHAMNSTGTIHGKSYHPVLWNIVCTCR